MPCLPKILVGVAGSTAVSCVDMLVDDADELSAIQGVASNVFDSVELCTLQSELYNEYGTSPQARIENFLHETVPNYSLLQFREHFRMSRSCFEVLM